MDETPPHILANPYLQYRGEQHQLRNWVRLRLEARLGYQVTRDRGTTDTLVFRIRVPAGEQLPDPEDLELGPYHVTATRWNREPGEERPGEALLYLNVASPDLMGYIEAVDLPDGFYTSRFHLEDIGPTHGTTIEADHPATACRLPDIGEVELS